MVLDVIITGTSRTLSNIYEEAFFIKMVYDTQMLHHRFFRIKYTTDHYVFTPIFLLFPPTVLFQLQCAYCFSYSRFSGVLSGYKVDAMTRNGLTINHLMPAGNKRSCVLKQTCSFQASFIYVSIAFYYHQALKS